MHVKCTFPSSPLNLSISLSWGSHVKPYKIIGVLLPESSRSRRSRTPSRTSRPQPCPPYPGSPPRPKCPPSQSYHPSLSALTSRAFPPGQDGHQTQGVQQSQNGPQGQGKVSSLQAPGQGQGRDQDQSLVYLLGLAYQLCQGPGAAAAAGWCRHFQAVHAVKRHHFSKIHIFD